MRNGTNSGKWIYLPGVLSAVAIERNRILSVCEPTSTQVGAKGAIEYKARDGSIVSFSFKATVAEILAVLDEHDEKFPAITDNKEK